MTKNLLLFALLVFSVSIAFAQQPKTRHAIVKGTVITSDGKPAGYVTIQIDNTNWGGITNEDGEYVIRNVKPGSWVLTMSSVASLSSGKKITVAAGQVLTVNFELSQNADELEEVVIASKRLNKENRFVAKMPLTDLENPQVYSSVSAETMKQQAITNYDDALRNIPGIVRTWESTGRAGDGAAYFALRGFDAQPFLYNGLPGLVSGNLDPANIEEIQVLKGPSATLFGGCFYSYGGLINTITKKPYYKTGAEIGYNVGSFGLHRITADVNTPLSKKEKIALRVNAAYHSEKTFQDAGFKKSFFVSPSLVYEVNDRLSFHAVAEILEEKRAVAPVFFHSDRLSPLPFKTIEELNLNNDLSFTSNDLTIKNPRFNLQTQMIYKLSDKWTSQTVFSYGTVQSDGLYTYIWDDVSGDNEFSQYFHDEAQKTKTTDIQQNFNADFTIGSVRNRLLIGLDYFSRNVVDRGSGWAWGRNVTPQGNVNYIDPFTKEPMPPLPLTREAVDNLLAGTDFSNSNIVNRSYSAYVSDVVNFTPKLSAMVSLRADYFDSKGEKDSDDDDFDQTALSPKLGLLYQPVLDKVSLFVNYLNAFINVAPMQVSDPDGSNPRIKSFKPEQANQWEFGVKSNLLSDRLFGTLSFYDITVRNRVSTDPNNINNSLQGGKVGSRGVELDVTAYPMRGLSVIAGFSHNKTRVIAGDKNDFYSEPGRSIGGQGPQNLANLWAAYKFLGGKLKDFGFGLGGNYGGEYKVIDNSATGVFTLPSYVVLNASVFYNAEHIRVAFNMNNLTNEEYYSGYWSVNPQRPANFVVSVGYKF